MRVLVVDDDDAVTMGLERSLQKNGFAEVVAAHSGPQALQLLGQKRFDVLVTDEFMEPMTGAELCEKAAALFPETIRIILTGTPTLRTVMEAINKGGVARVLVKSASFGEVASAIDAVLIESRMGPKTESRLSSLAHLTSAEVEALTVREREVLASFNEGKRVNQLAEEFCISRHTMRNHLKAIFVKLRVHSQVELLKKLRGTP